MPDVSSFGSGATPDNQSIKFNAQGQLAVITSDTIEAGNNGVEVVKNEVLLGDFEDGNSGGWDNPDGEYFVFDDNGGAEGTTDYWVAFAANAGTYRTRRNYDLTKITSLVVYVRVDPRTNGRTGSSSDEWEIQVGRDVVASDTAGSATSWLKYSVDVSSYSGSTQIKLVVINNSGNDYNVGFDRIKALGGVAAIQGSVDNAGGGTL